MFKKIVFFILFLGTNTVFYEIKSSPPNNLIQEKIITGDLIIRCLEKILDLDRHYWYYFAAEIAQEFSDNPWLLVNNHCENNHYVVTTEREKFLSQLIKTLQSIAESPQGVHPLKQKFADVAKAIYEKHYSLCRQEKGKYYYSYNVFQPSS